MRLSLPARRPRLRSRSRVLAVTAAAGLVLAACSDDGGGSADPSASEAPSTATSGSDTPGTAGGELPDPNEEVEDGLYRGAGVILPVPEGWTVNPQARAQGIVTAASADGTAQLTAQAIDREEAAAAGQELGLDSLLEALRAQVPGDAAVDEPVELAGADRAHRLTFLDVPGQGEGAPSNSATIILAETDQRVGEFVLSATSDAYDEATVELLLSEAGFDPDSEPPALPPAPTTDEQPPADTSTEPTTGESTSTDTPSSEAATEAG